MDETTPGPNIIEQQKQQSDAVQQRADAITGSVLDWGIAPLLNAQADLLANAEANLGDWLRRRHEALADTQNLIARMHSGMTDPGDALRAQQEVLSRSFQRLAADTDAYHSAVRRLIDRAPTWFPRAGWDWLPRDAESAGSDASRTVATRGATRSFRATNRPE